MLARRFALVFAALLAPATALASPPPAPVVPAAPAAKAPPPKRYYAKPKPKEPTAPPPSVALTLEAPASRGTWKMRVENTGDVPVRLVADARLLTLELTPPPKEAVSPKKKAKPKTVVCALPADMRPIGDVDRALVLAPKRSYTESIDPRLYCFGAKASEALTAGTKIVAHLGWYKSHGTSAPFVVSPFEGVTPVVRAEKELVAAETEIGGTSDAAPVSSTTADVAPPKAGDDPYPTRLTLATTKHVDVEITQDLPMTVTVRNEGVRPVTLLLRPETLAFEVIGPHSTNYCSWPQRVGGTVREAFTTLHPKRSESISLLLDALCPESTFDQPGLYIVRPRLDTRHADGEIVGIQAFAGEIIGTHTTLLRVHRGTRPARNVRPALDPL